MKYRHAAVVIFLVTVLLYFHGKASGNSPYRSLLALPTWLNLPTQIQDQELQISSTVNMATKTSNSQPTSTATGIALLRERRVAAIVKSVSDAGNVTAWNSTLGLQGKWPDSEVDYTTGCDARRANWPAQIHWRRIVTMAGAWHGGVRNQTEGHVNNPDLRRNITQAMEYWLSNDFENPACIDKGGQAECPCGTPGFWNTNWYSNVILIPSLVGQAALLLSDSLSTTHLEGCKRIASRAWGYRARMTGANTLDVARIALDQGLFTNDSSLVRDVYTRAHQEVAIQLNSKDGIRPDGSFGQHEGILYNGNYGKDFVNDVLGLEVEAAGTEWEATKDTQLAFETHMNGNLWMIYFNNATEVHHWDYSTLGRFISFPVKDNQATGSIKFNPTHVHALGKAWKSSALLQSAKRLKENVTHANTGNLTGNRMFFANDYMVHRGPSYVTTLKMYSSRTRNTECINTQNPYGFHLSDGALRTYINGTEYEDIAAAWDWHMIPGITVDYKATALECRNTRWNGVENFVGGASDGRVGISAMRYTNPFTRKLSWQKAWFFLEGDVQHVMISQISSSTDAPIVSVLDQKLHQGSVFVDGTALNDSASVRNIRSLWHNQVGYTFDQLPNGHEVSIKWGNRTGNWSNIGTSKQPPITVNLFTASITHSPPFHPIEYTVFPAVSLADYATKNASTKLRTLQNDASACALYDDNHDTATVAFWMSGTVHITFQDGRASIAVSVDVPCTIIYHVRTGKLLLSDPSQTRDSVEVKLEIGDGHQPALWSPGSKSVTLRFDLPSDGMRGSTIEKLIG